LVRLIAVLEAPKDVHGVVHGGLADQHGLEPTLQRRVLLYVLAVLVNGCGAHDVQLAARQGGL
jgi:phage shock protein PspC (stress-responsive transcriptional regulator)